VGLNLEYIHVSKFYQGVPVLRDCSFTFPLGSSYAVMGPNGSGKSTLFRIGALLEEPDRGEVRFSVGGQLLPQDLHLRRRVTMVFPRVGLFNRSVYQNVAYGLEIRGVGGREQAAQVERVLELVGLAAKKQQHALTLSSGEAMRLGLARALVIEPEVLFLDEPTTSLDPANAGIIEDCLLRLRRERQMTLLLVTHDPAQAWRLGDALLRMENGRLVAADLILPQECLT